MFKKLHIQMTLFSTLITGTILVIMALTCLFIAENSARTSSYSSFTGNARSMILQLEQEPTVSHQWLRQSMSSYGVEIRIRDNGEALYFEQLEDISAYTEAFETAAQISRDSYQLDPDRDHSNLTLTQTAEFRFDGYYACTALIPNSGGILSLVILYPLTGLYEQLNTQRLAFALIVLAAIGALALFSWFFTRRMIRPLEENRREQTAFIAAASHELRSPLAVIHSGLSAVPDASPERAQSFLDIALKECDRMARLIQDMLSLSNADNLSLTLNAVPCEPDTLLLETYEKYQPLAHEKGLFLKIELPLEPLSICICDSGKITQLLGILIDNALSYVPAGGEIRLSVKELSGSLPCKKDSGFANAGKRLAHLLFKNSASGQQNTGTVIFIVSDNGPGIPDSEKASIFKRFYRSDAARGGKEHFGLGLSIAAEIAALHGADLTVTDTPGGGATFALSLPVRDNFSDSMQ